MVKYQHVTYCKYWYVYLLQTIEISLDHCEMWHFFKKHVNIFIIHKTTSPTAADTILMTASMPVRPYLVITVNERALEKTNDWDVITQNVLARKQQPLDEHLVNYCYWWKNIMYNKCFVFLQIWNIERKNHILQFHKYLLNTCINFRAFWCCVN